MKEIYVKERAAVYGIEHDHNFFNPVNPKKKKKFK